MLSQTVSNPCACTSTLMQSALSQAEYCGDILWKPVTYYVLAVTQTVAPPPKILLSCQEEQRHTRT